MTPYKTNREKFRHQFYEVQDRRCPVCDMEVEYGARTCKHKPSGLILCQRCWLLIQYIDGYIGPTLDRAIKLIRENKL